MMPPPPYETGFYPRPLQENIAELAYKIWQETGREDADANWNDAEDILFTALLKQLF